MVNLTFYYREGCWLCVTAEDMLNGMTEKYNIKVTKIDVDSDDELYGDYSHDIPVIEFKDGSALHGNIKKKVLLEKLKNYGE